jgi:hypothetical protein
MKIAYMLIALILMALFATSAAQTAAAGAARQPVNPQISINVTTATDGTKITIQGTGFPPNQRFPILQGNPAPFGEPLGSAEADAQGRFTATVTIEGYMPSGAPITSREGAIFVVDDQFESLAHALFTFQPVGSTPGMPTTGAPGAWMPAVIAALGLVLVVLGLRTRRRVDGTT